MPAKCKKASSPPAHQDEFERSGLYDFEDDDPRPPPKAWKRIQQESEDNETSSSDESENTNEVDDPRRKKSRRYTEKSKQVIARGIDKDEEGCTPTSGSNIQVPMKQFYQKLDEQQTAVKKMLTDPSVSDTWKAPIYIALDELFIQDKYPTRQTIKNVTKKAYEKVLMNQYEEWDFKIFWSKIKTHCFRHLREARTRAGKKIRKMFVKQFGRVTLEVRKEKVKQLSKRGILKKWASKVFPREQRYINENDQTFVLYALDCYANGINLGQGSKQQESDEEQSASENDDKEMDLETATNSLFHKNPA